jgi:uncharacterized membrane protein
MDELLFHPKLVHVPLGLAITVPVIAVGVLIAWWRGWLGTRAWWIVVMLQLMLVAGALVAANSGERDEELVERIVAERFIEAHEELAETFVIGSAVILVLALFGAALPNPRWRQSAAAAATIGMFVVAGLAVRTGSAGGDLVYRHGAGQVLAQGQQEVPVDD